MKQSGKMDEKAAGYLQVGAAIVGLGAIIYTSVTHIKEKAQIVDYLKQVKEMEGKQEEIIALNYDKMTLLLNELQDAIQNKIIKTVDFLSRFQLYDNRAVNVLQKLHGFVTRYFDFTQKYRVFNAYAEHFALYMNKEVFSLDLPIQKAVEAKEAFLMDLKELFKKMNNGSGTVGMQYMVLNYNLFLSDKQFKDERKTLSGSSIKEIAQVMNIKQRLPEIKKTTLNKIVDKNIKEIEAIGSERSATKEKVGIAIGHVIESAKENQKKGNIQTEQLLLEYIGTMISEDRGINRACQVFS